MMQEPVTVPQLQSRKSRGEKITMVTAYDATFAALFAQAGVDILLVGDSLGMAVQGHANTLPVTLEDIIYHTRAVSRGGGRAQLVADMPFMSYQVSKEQAVRSAGRLVQEGFAHAVKLEGGSWAAPWVEHMVQAGIAVMGHIGLTPQSVHQLGGFRVQGRDAATAQKLLDAARCLAEAGCYALVLEGMPSDVAAAITQAVPIPTLGIGAGPGCDGQVLVGYDLLGLNPHFKPKFVHQFAVLHEQVVAATQNFVQQVQGGTFPAPQHCYRSSEALRLHCGSATSATPEALSNNRGLD